ncbi:hypothetical protein ADK60_27995 [Streptomyces sp. XY431]|uniref:hypothetical protein n=1 Tax=Streptomyces sp. XY431 TaxID=1415562 RepID=UPI0006AE31E6|nr:hypothetical protein [Streptomyces sp. XY431]KOV15452.1 hypothetical protein ADK60_27995 [Streptomyces sp. XY431]
MTNPMPEAVTGDLIRWARQVLSSAGGADEETAAWAAELAGLSVPPDGPAEVDTSGLTPDLRSFLGTLAESSVSPGLALEEVEPHPGPERWPDAPVPAEDPVDEVPRHYLDGQHCLFLSVDIESFGREQREPLLHRLRVILDVAARLAGWEEPVAAEQAGDGVLYLVPEGVDRSSLGLWVRCLVAELPRHVPPHALALWIGRRRPEEWESRWATRGSRGVRRLLASRREPAIGRFVPGAPVVAVEEEVFTALGGRAGRVLGIAGDGWYRFEGPPGRGGYWAAALPGVAGASGAGPGTSSGAPSELLLLGELVGRVRELVCALIRDRAGGRRPWPSLLEELKGFAVTLALLDQLVALPDPLSLRELSGQVSTAVRELDEFGLTGRAACAESAERRLFGLVLLLGPVVPEGGGPSVAGPPAPPVPQVSRLRRSGLQLTTPSMRAMHSDDRFV